MMIKDGLIDEVGIWDTDLDSITYFVVYGGGKIDYTFRLSDGDELYYYGTNPTYGDTDLDGITDWKVNDWAVKGLTSWVKVPRRIRHSAFFLNIL